MKYIKKFLENIEFSSYTITHDDLVNISSINPSDIFDYLEISEILIKEDGVSLSLIGPDKKNITYIESEIKFESYLQSKITFHIESKNSIFSDQPIDSLNSQLEICIKNNESIQKILKRYSKLKNVDIKCNVTNIVRFEVIITERKSCSDDINKIYRNYISSDFFIELNRSISELEELYKKHGVNPVIIHNEFDISDPDQKSVLIGFSFEDEIMVVAKYDKIKLKLNIMEKEFQKSIYRYFEEQE